MCLSAFQTKLATTLGFSGPPCFRLYFYERSVGPQGTAARLCNMLSFYHILSTLSAIPNVTLNNGVIMPMISAGTWQYDGPTAEQVVKLALSLGYNHIDAANDYNNQVSVGAGLKGVPRSSYFLTTKIDSQQQSKTAYDATMKDMELSLTQLDLDYVDLMLIHFPPTGNDQYCAAMQEQWRACEDFYKAGKARSIGVSNYCPSSFECILKTANITPAVNQVEIHVGMGPDPGDIISYCKGKGVQVQAYSPLGDGSSELITGDLVTGIGKAYNKTGAQVSLHWVYQHGIPLSTKSTNPQYLTDNQNAVSDDWKFSAQDFATLDAATSPSGHYSFKCTK